MRETQPASNSAAVGTPDETDSEEVELLRGFVPQPADWVYTYKDIQKFTSWRSSELKARPHSGIVRGKRHISRRQLVSMIRVWGTVVRSRKLQWISRCTSLWLGMDDRRPFKIVRFRCNAESDFTPSFFAGAHCADTGCRMGILAGCSALPGDDFDGGYAIRTSEKAIHAMKKVLDRV